jgi:diphthamide biosynthesis methyltransferase
MVKYGKVKFLPPRFMTVNTAIEQLLEIESERQQVVGMQSLACFDLIFM